MKSRRKPLPPLNALKAFEAAARLRSLTRAAEELHVTQGAISQQVKLLEEYLDAQLFVRKPRKLELTDAAQAYLPLLTEAFSTLQAGTNQLFATDQRALLNVKCGSSFMQRWLMPRLADFYRQHPGINIRLMSSVWPSQDEVETADLEISNGFGDWRGMQVERLTRERWLLVASPDFLARYSIHDDAVRAQQLPLISTVGEQEHWVQWFRSQGVLGFYPQPVLECDTSTASIDAACHHVGLLMCRSFSVAPVLASGQLQQAHSFTLPASGAHYLVLPNKPSAPKVTAFSQWLKGQMAQEEQFFGA
ncbi:LysR substrate-binding domain-containing protein [Marinobacterium rhizophilum]|uniref:LysR family transcriptional regulator n=1 Tax=Marinobacterium rhizophilum TaxID=420402 RepID=A0ABY5HRW8_9GAMM|nr:LysR substrate-binding domain-containing protein [Marinobacterium rhizophilum]UTW13671.1 LysR family transcriptional regulator [Marinobacterium rhizophilum]